MRTILATAALLLVAGCGGAESGGGNAAAPVAAATPPAGANWVETVSATPEGGFRMGNPDAAIKLVEYGSRTCPACAAFSNGGAEALKSRYVATGKVSWEFRDFAIHGAPDLAAGVLGRCNGAATFFPLLEQMYAEQSATLDRIQAAAPALQARLGNTPPLQTVTAWAEAAGYIDFVKQRGIPEAKARQCLADPKLLDQIVKLTESGQDQVPGTPTFLLNGQAVPNAISIDQLEPALKAAGA